MNSLFQQLVLSREGCETLLYILEKCPDLVSCIPKSALFDGVPSLGSSNALFFLRRFQAKRVLELFSHQIQEGLKLAKVECVNTPFNFHANVPKKAVEKEENSILMMPMASV